jgi:beta-lactamase class A
MKAVNAFADSIGCSDSRQNRLMLDDNGLQNYTTAKDCAVILGLIYSGKCVSEKWSAEMLSLLKAQTVNNRLPASLPSGTVTAHKTGDLAKLSCGDVGIIYSPACDYILCAICNDPYSDDGAAKAIAELSRQVYDYYN